MATAPNFQPVPTYADPVLDEVGRPGPWKFNPIWLNWFLLLTKGEVSGTIDHADLAGLQGGTTGQYYHLTQAQFNGVYIKNNGAVFNIAPGPSPFLYQNVATYNLDVIVTGGAGVALTFSRDNITFYALPAAGVITLSPGDYLNIVYVGVPTVTGVPR